METVMSWGAEKWQGALPGQVQVGEEVGVAETAREASWFLSLRLKSSLRTREVACLVLKKLPIIDGKCWAGGMNTEKIVGQFCVLLLH